MQLAPLTTAALACLSPSCLCGSSLDCVIILLMALCCNNARFLTLPPLSSLQDQTQTNLVNLRRTIYLTIMSSMDFEESGHKLMKINIGEEHKIEIVVMLIECCSQEKTYIKWVPAAAGALMAS